MIVPLFIQLLAALGTLFAAAACLYYAFLACAALRDRQPVVRAGPNARHRFAILIPAHDEEASIADVLASCAELDYPPSQYQVVVVADNCTDRTAAIAAAHGARVLERHDPEQRGKGPALAWALERILPGRPDAVIVLDADCKLDRLALRVFDRYLTAGDQVLQCAYVASNPDESIASYVTSVANRVENDLFYRPKSRLGLAVLLRGTGMVFQRAVLERYPWQAHSVVEDVEYAAQLYQAGIRVTFVPEISVSSAFPARKRQMVVQRTRWIGGNFRMAVSKCGPLLWQGLRQGRLDLIDLGWTLFVSIRSLIVLQAFLAVALGALAVAVAPGRLSESLLGSACVFVALHALGFVLGAFRLGLSARRVSLLVQAPKVLLRLLLIAVASILPGRIRSWERTPR